VRRITTHHTNEVNLGLLLEADDRNPDNGNASHEYRINYYEKSRAGDYSVPSLQTLSFQNGPIGEVGVNGVTNEVLLAIVIDRLEGFQSSKFACEENERALEHCKDALAALEDRTRNREARGVEGTHNV
jgi:hypothetical protein